MTDLGALETLAHGAWSFSLSGSAPKLDLNALVVASRDKFLAKNSQRWAPRTTLKWDLRGGMCWWNQRRGP